MLAGCSRPVKGQGSLPVVSTFCLWPVFENHVVSPSLEHSSSGTVRRDWVPSPWLSRKDAYVLVVLTLLYPRQPHAAAVTA